VRRAHRLPLLPQGGRCTQYRALRVRRGGAYPRAGRERRRTPRIRLHAGGRCRRPGLRLALRRVLGGRLRPDAARAAGGGNSLRAGRGGSCRSRCAQ
jgi:hypothetical protein